MLSPAGYERLGYGDDRWKKGIRSLRCGEPIWGTFGEAIKEMDIPEQRQSGIIQELRQFPGVR
ncbi:MAG: hypothetical protein KFH87_11300 [Bacteroidetes bacterium]|nr:hypothetical protein [Bacteroidota bacterium]